ncbi:hypothetical protein B0H11DRAFT_1898257 [Mycena galericulata]|nr:hypothetical protein B0H11DRAFT_1898257 [Mycena galericulata]
MLKLIKQPKLLWTNWGPKKSLEQYSSIEELWTAYVDGAPEVDDSGNTTGWLKPPLKLVEQYFQASWRAPDDKKASRASASSSSEPKGLNWLQKDVSRQRKEAVAQHRGLTQVASSLAESASAESSSVTPQPLLASSTTDRKRK